MTRTLRFVGARLGGMVVVLLVVSFGMFAVFYLLPTDPAIMSCGKPCTPENLALARQFMGFDKPWIQQYLDFLGGIFTGRTFGTGATAIVCAAPCFGYSFQQSEPVLTLIGDRLPVTVSLAVGAAVLWLAAGVATGVLSALRRGRATDRIAMTVTLAGVSAPAYLVGLLGILLFGFTLDVVPVNGYVPLAESPVDWAWHLVLPWLVLAFINAAVYARLSRGQMLEVLGEDFIRTARAVGLPERTVVGKYALRNVLLPVVTVFAIDLGSLLGGAVITERVFALPGLGGLLVDAVHQVDLPLLMGVSVFAAFFVVLANFVVDVLYGVLDPRARVR
ncbi:peptide/nickel transport system permease protein [Amycolatopsis sacchari]|uniref:Peptide/nickel transport system permease protein n=1 Tax=Amycolatopsis sacchari TaxID=115433 RepID=A0A1I3T459_9PSEU|nr:ABC transporter permease [Amycolatopsis sacchari]SFJ65292.1 peptide/nickel transport system permease protein [Amycolatopsis sacchari]